MMNMEHRLVQTQSQQLVLTQKMQQALQILQLNGLELEQFVQQEMETNPFLEQQRKKEEPERKPDDGRPKEEDTAFDESFDLDSFRDNWGIRHREGRDLSHNPDNFARQQYYEDSITQEESLRALLLNQMRIATDDDTLYAVGERIIIGDIDDRGYFTGDEREIAMEMGIPEQTVWEALSLLQRCEPTGVGAHDVVECLLLQIDAEYPDEPELRILVRDHLEELKQRQIPKIARAMNTTPDRVEELKGLLATLDPWPGRAYSSGPPQYIQPELEVELVEDKFVVRLASETSSSLEINENFIRQARKSDMTKEEREYIREKIESARWLARNITQRQQTIVKVAQAIVDVQRDFLLKGVEHIRPLKLQDIAETIGMHESTVARTTRGKYMQTPQGLFELKYFFSPGLRRDTGEDQSSKSIQAQIRKIIEEEDKRKPLSDQKIANLLKEQGTNIARRTVTKYREGMGILSTTMRREYQG